LVRTRGTREPTQRRSPNAPADALGRSLASVEVDAELGRTIVEDAKRYVLYSWSVQDAILSIAVAGGGVECAS
jgi:hypothetical protein